MCIFCFRHYKLFMKEGGKKVELPEWVYHKCSLNSQQDMGTDNFTCPSEDFMLPSTSSFFDVSPCVEEVSQADETKLTIEPILADIITDAPTTYHIWERRSGKGMISLIALDFSLSESR